MDGIHQSKIIREWSFGTNKKLAKKLETLVLSEIKTATTGLYKNEQSVPVVGEHAYIIDNNTARLCEIEYTKVMVKPFLEVDYEHVIKEGEGDKDIESWRESHREFFQKEHPNTFTDNSLVACEEFKVVKRF